MNMNCSKCKRPALYAIVTKKDDNKRHVFTKAQFEALHLVFVEEILYCEECIRSAINLLLMLEQFSHHLCSTCKGICDKIITEEKTKCVTQK